MRPQRIIEFDARRPDDDKGQDKPLAYHSRRDCSELEYSEYGRDPRFLPGWWVIPLSLISMISFWLYLNTY